MDNWNRKLNQLANNKLINNLISTFSCIDEVPTILLLFYVLKQGTIWSQRYTVSLTNPYQCDYIIPQKFQIIYNKSQSLFLIRSDSRNTLQQVKIIKKAISATLHLEKNRRRMIWGLWKMTRTNRYHIVFFRKIQVTK